jgi:very-short-patch-repair endonuclease
MAAVLWGGPTALASHRSAGLLWRLNGLEEAPVEVSVAAGRRARSVIVHRRRAGDEVRRVVKEHIPTTGIERTLLDLAGSLSPARAGLALDDALHRRLTNLDDLEKELVQGRRGARALRALIEARDASDAAVESRLESAFLRLIRRHRLPVPLVQYRVEQGGSVVARLDFAYPVCLLGIETDGYRWHGGRERWSADLRRENRLKLLGWTILRFSSEDIHDRPGDVAQQVRAALHARGSLGQLRFPTSAERTWRARTGSSRYNRGAGM